MLLFNMAPKRRWNLNIDGKSIYKLIKRQKIDPTDLSKDYILAVKKAFPKEFGEFENEKTFISNYKNTIGKIRSGEYLEGSRSKSKSFIFKTISWNIILTCLFMAD